MRIVDLGLGLSASAIELDATGRFFVTAWSDASPDMVVARFNSEGTLDPTFGNDGTRRMDFTGGVDRAMGLARAADGTLFVAGDATDAAGIPSLAIWRLKP